MEKVQWNSINKKNKMVLNNRKMTNQPQSPDLFLLKQYDTKQHDTEQHD